MTVDPVHADLNTLLRSRRMCRDFSDTPVEDQVLQRMLDGALGAPSAGNTRGLHMVVLRGGETARYWDVTLAPHRRDGFRWQGLLNAPLLILPYVSPDAYLQRYSEPDKAHTALGGDARRWPVPYWFVDGGAAVMAMLLVAEDAGLGALFFGQFDHADAVSEVLGVPPGYRTLGTVAVGHRRAGGEPGASERRGRPATPDHVHFGRW